MKLYAIEKLDPDENPLEPREWYDWSMATFAPGLREFALSATSLTCLCAEIQSIPVPCRVVEFDLVERKQ